jgi:pimeloyl-ACP methyl ester carboxylesterase
MPPGVKFASTDDGDIAYVDHGEGPPALFVHGVFLNSHLWRHVIEGVADVRRCIAVDLLAHGATRIAADQDVSFDAQARMLEGVCRALGLEQVDLVGNDSGGGIAQIFAARHPDRIRTLTLTNSDVHDNWPPPALGPLLRAVAQGRLADIGRGLLADVGFARRFFGPGLEHPERISPETFHAYLAPLFANAEATANLERFFASIDCRQTVAIEPLLKRLMAPTLVVWGTDDIFFPLKWAYWLRDTIPGCREVIALKGARLFFPEERPETLASALRDHWQATGPSARRSA